MNMPKIMFDSYPKTYNIYTKIENLELSKSMQN